MIHSRAVKSLIAPALLSASFAMANAESGETPSEEFKTLAQCISEAKQAGLRYHRKFPTGKAVTFAHMIPDQAIQTLYDDTFSHMVAKGCESGQTELFENFDTLKALENRLEEIKRNGPEQSQSQPPAVDTSHGPNQALG